MAVKSSKPEQRRAVIVGGVRTPFVRAFGEFMKLDTIALSDIAVRALLQRTPAPWKEIDSVVWGGVILPSTTVNLAREIVLDIGLPPTVEGTTVTRACTTGLKAITNAAMMIERGDADVIIAGGSDSTSNAEVMMPRTFVHKTAPVLMNSKATAKDYLGLLTKLNPRRDLVPQRPAIRERTTGELMGESAEKMAQRNGVTREEQDAYAAQSHQRAAAAIASGRLAAEIAPVETPGGKTVHVDNIVRGDTSIEKLAKLRPAFAKDGTLTAGNSTPLTDGAGAVLLMSYEKAKALGLTPLAAFRSWSYGGVDPWDQLLMGPALTMPDATARAGMTAADIDLVDLHEAFAAQVLSVLKMINSDQFGRERLGLPGAFAKWGPGDINVHGGSIALGHPFGATGVRMVLTMANELKLTGKQTALIGICAAGGLSAGAVLEAVA
jgi:acetyl-CoA acyltransferase